MPTKHEIFEALRGVKDPELGYSVVDLGLIYDATIAPEGTCTMRYTLTSPTCSLADVLEKDARDALRTVPTVTDVRIDLTFDPPWGPEKIADDSTSGTANNGNGGLNVLIPLGLGELY